LAVPGVFLLFGEHAANGLLVLTLLALILLVWYFLNKPEFTVLRIDKTLSISDASGSKATLLRDQTAQANHKGITEFWCRNISADGTISNILINGEPPAKQIKEAGDIQVCMQISPPPRARERFKMALSYDLTDSFLTARESLIHVVEAETKLLRMVVELPKQRMPKTARLFLRFGGQVFKELKAPIVAGARIEAEIKRPRLGAEYCLHWEW
jgi:hypothetical protein